MRKIRFVQQILILICICVGSNQMDAKTISLDMANPTYKLQKKDIQVNKLIVTGTINGNTINTILDLYPNVENLDLLNSKIVAYTDTMHVVYPANEIYAGAFSKKNKIKKVILPHALIKIGKGAFWSCTGLESIVFPSTITVIDRFAFQHCVKLKSITLPENLQSIGGATFSGCQSLSTVKCLSKNPPKMPEWNPFDDIKSTDLIIYVPAQSLKNYKNIPFLKNFTIMAL